MIKYDLALALKNAGFPQLYKDGEVLLEDMLESGEHEPDTAYAPTLSELIEACGDKFHGVYVAGGNWKAHGFKSDNEFDDAFTHGETPEIAVANLYLQINSKK